MHAFITWSYLGEYYALTLEELLFRWGRPHWVNVRVSWGLKLEEDYRLTSSILTGEPTRLNNDSLPFGHTLERNFNHSNDGQPLG
jgi:hypothetical protein